VGSSDPPPHAAAAKARTIKIRGSLFIADPPTRLRRNLHPRRKMV
jgi:hypothetical protein